MRILRLFPGDCSWGFGHPPARRRSASMKNCCGGIATWAGAIRDADHGGPVGVELRRALEPGDRDSFRDRLNYGLALLRSGDTRPPIWELRAGPETESQLPYTCHSGYCLPSRRALPGGHSGVRAHDPTGSRRACFRTTKKPGLLYKETSVPRKRSAVRDGGQAGRKTGSPRFPDLQRLPPGRQGRGSREGLEVFKARQAAAEGGRTTAEDMEWSFYAELYDPIQAQTMASDRPAGRVEVPGSQTGRRARPRKLPAC